MDDPPAPPLTRLLLVTGMSGAGKSTVLDALEDLGWDCVDNLPTALLHDFVHGEREAREERPVAVGMDMRSRGFNPVRLPAILADVEGVEPEILFLDCSDPELIRRFDKTRRRHPLAPDRPTEDGIAKERELTEALRQIAHAVLDTTDFKPADLRDELKRRYGGTSREPVLTVTSFGFGRGTSRTADLVFDMRFLENPFWEEELRPLSGEDQAIQDFISSDPGYAPTMEKIEGLLLDLIPRYWAADKHYLTIAFGCTGGRHRSVAAALDMAKRLRGAGYEPNVRHRDLAHPPSETIEQQPNGPGVRKRTK